MKYTELRKALEKATDGDWFLDESHQDFCFNFLNSPSHGMLAEILVRMRDEPLCTADQQKNDQLQANADLIILARNQLPDIFSDLDNANTDLEAAKIRVADLESERVLLAETLEKFADGG